MKYLNSELATNLIEPTESVSLNLNTNKVWYNPNNFEITFKDDNYYDYDYTLTDKVDLTWDSEHKYIGTLTYTRSGDLSGYNSVCLPFALTKEMFGDDAENITFWDVTEWHTDTKTISLLSMTSVPAGYPCLIESTSGTSWNLTAHNLIVKDYGSNITNTSEFVLNPSKAPILTGALQKVIMEKGGYKLSSTGIIFGYASAGSKITAFRVGILQETIDNLPNT